MNTQKFLSKIQKHENGCWLWTGAKITSGYGQAFFGSKVRGAHRVSYEMHKGPISDGLVLDHLCRNPSCVNPDHLEAVSQRENTRRGINHVAKNMVKTSCIRGHRLFGDNLIPYSLLKNGTRACRTCARDRQRIRRKLYGMGSNLKREHKHIYKDKAGYVVEIKRSSFKRRKYCSTLAEALSLRNAMLKEVGAP